MRVAGIRPQDAFIALHSFHEHQGFDGVITVSSSAGYRAFTPHPLQHPVTQSVFSLKGDRNGRQIVTGQSEEHSQTPNSQDTPARRAPIPCSIGYAGRQVPFQIKGKHPSLEFVSLWPSPSLKPPLLRPDSGVSVPAGVAAVAGA